LKQLIRLCALSNNKSFKKIKLQLPLLHSLSMGNNVQVQVDCDETDDVSTEEAGKKLYLGGAFAACIKYYVMSLNLRF
jgi:hypothetical protein